MSIVKFSYTKEIEVIRFDSNYYNKTSLTQENVIRKNKYFTLKDLGISLLSFGAYSLNNDVDYLAKGIPFIRGVNLKNGRVDFSDMIFISEEANKLLWKSKIEPEIIMLSMSGTIGDVALASKNWTYPINSNQDIAKIRCNDKYNPYLLYSFLSSKFGQNYLIREARGSVQQHVFLSQMEMFEVPIFSEEFGVEIQRVIELSNDEYSQTKTLYSEAESILLHELGLYNWQPAIKNNHTKTLKESFLSSGRIDAEYYQPKYDEIEMKIKNYSGGFDLVGNICNVKTHNFQPENNITYTYIELANIGSNGVIKDVIRNEGKNLPSRARRIVKTNDIIVSSVEGSLSSCAIIPKELNDSICSTGFYVINSEYINSETLLLLFKSAVIYLMEKGCSGTILTAINNEEFFKVPLPLIDVQTQKTISDKIQQSFVLQTQSNQLLEAAKKAVEIAIEQNEKTAMDYLQLTTNINN